MTSTTVAQLLHLKSYAGIVRSLFIQHGRTRLSVADCRRQAGYIGPREGRKALTGILLVMDDSDKTFSEWLSLGSQPDESPLDERHDDPPPEEPSPEEPTPAPPEGGAAEAKVEESPTSDDGSPTSEEESPTGDEESPTGDEGSATPEDEPAGESGADLLPEETPAEDAKPEIAPGDAAAESPTENPPPAEETAEVPAQPPVAPGPAAPWTPPAPGARRKPLIPRWVFFAAGGVVLLIALIIAVAVLGSRSGDVRVPSLAGLDSAAAAARLKAIGLVLKVGDRRFSATAPMNSVVEQSPKAGSMVAEGSTVVVAISGGSESFAMPDVVGSMLDDARSRLRDRGLSVEVESTTSDQPQGTVLETVPAPGATVSTGDTVRLSVAAGGGSANTLLPTNLTGKVFVIDPAPMPATGAIDASGAVVDTSMDIARRVRALLEASGATVRMTRESADSGESLSDAARVLKAKEASANALIGFSVTSSGPQGVAVLSMPTTSSAPAYASQAAALGTAAAEALKQTSPTVQTGVATDDAVLSSAGVAAFRIRLGSSDVEADRLTFADPQWADNVAQAVYRAVASVYGVK